jgi:hypothetical protein
MSYGGREFAGEIDVRGEIAPRGLPPLQWWGFRSNGSRQGSAGRQHRGGAGNTDELGGTVDPFTKRTNFWGFDINRAARIAATGHGGNSLLRQGDPRHFRFTIFQRVSPDMVASDVIRLEGSWKQRLHTRKPHGLNEN